MWLLSLASQDTDCLVFVYWCLYSYLLDEISNAVRIIFIFSIFFLTYLEEKKNVFKRKIVPGLIAVLTVCFGITIVS